jgi:hypothetical protein
MKKLLRYLLYITLFIYFIYGLYNLFFLKTAYTDCGSIRNKEILPVYHKNSGRNQFMMGVDFKSGYQVLNVTPTTYYSKNIGENICFDLDIKRSWYQTISWVHAVLGLIFIGYWCILFFLNYIFGWKLFKL